MNTIDVQQIGTNRYAPAGADAVRLYSTNGSEGLTIAQLVAAVCIRRCACLETRATARMNKMTQNNAFMQALANVCKQVVDGAKMTDVANVPDSYDMRIPRGSDIRHFLLDECRMDTNVLLHIGDEPNYKSRMQIVGLIKTGMDKANTTSQQDVIELQSMVNWRDVTYNASSGIIARYGNSGMNMAQNI
jgi:hypothetical protein